MNVLKKYVQPVVIALQFPSEDIITTSQGDAKEGWLVGDVYDVKEGFWYGN